MSKLEKSRKGSWRSSMDQLQQISRMDRGMFNACSETPLGELQECSLVSDDGWGRDGDISMPNGPHGDECVKPSNNYLAQSMNARYISEESLKTIRDQFLASVNNVESSFKTPILALEVECECGKDKHGFAGKHSHWCKKFEG